MMFRSWIDHVQLWKDGDYLSALYCLTAKLMEELEREVSLLLVFVGNAEL